MKLGQKWYLITFYFYDALFVGVSVASYKFMNYHLQMEMFGKQSVITQIWATQSQSYFRGGSYSEYNFRTIMWNYINIVTIYMYLYVLHLYAMALARCEHCW